MNRSQHAAQGTAGFAGWRQQQHRRGSSRAGEQGMYLVALVISMVGITYASVPLYRAFCQATGFGGTVQQGDTVEAKLKAREENPDAALEAAAANCPLTISFNANVIDGMPWKFIPTQRTIKVRLTALFLSLKPVHRSSYGTQVASIGLKTHFCNDFFNSLYLAVAAESSQSLCTRISIACLCWKTVVSK